MLKTVSTISGFVSPTFTGDVTLSDGNLVIGTSGKGIDFSATPGTGTSELFDDYEEGAWTPVVADATTGGNTASSGFFTGLYTKIGDTVVATCSAVNVGTVGMTAGNAVTVQGLPFVALNNSGVVIYTGAVSLTSNTYSGKPIVRILDNNSYVSIFDSTTAASLIVSELTSGAADIYFTITYKTS